MISEVMLAEEDLGEKIGHVGLMGIGEPMDNYDNVITFLKNANHNDALNIGMRNISLSTCGIVPMIKKLATENLGITLCISLHNPFDDRRSEIMPINKRWPLEQLLQACRDHCEASGDKVTFEYVLLKDVTDSLEDARALAQLTRSVPCKINIIPFNEHPESGFHRPVEAAIVRFQNELIRLGCHVLRRKTMGRDIYAACGQLTTAANKAEIRV